MFIETMTSSSGFRPIMPSYSNICTSFMLRIRYSSLHRRHWKKTALAPLWCFVFGGQQTFLGWLTRRHLQLWIYLCSALQCCTSLWFHYHTQGDQVWLNQSNQISRFQYKHLSTHKWTQFTYDYLWFQRGARTGGLLHSGESHGRGQVPKGSQQTVATWIPIIVINHY